MNVNSSLKTLALSNSLQQHFKFDIHPTFLPTFNKFFLLIFTKITVFTEWQNTALNA